MTERGRERERERERKVVLMSYGAAIAREQNLLNWLLPGTGIDDAASSSRRVATTAFASHAP